MITLTENAANKIKTLLAEKEETGIRAAVQGGGCSGFIYGPKLVFWLDLRPQDGVLA